MARSTSGGTAELTRGRTLAALAAYTAAELAYTGIGAATKAAACRVGSVVASGDTEATIRIAFARRVLGGALIPVDPDGAEAELVRAIADCRRAGIVPCEIAARAYLSILATSADGTTRASPGCSRSR